MMNSPFLNDCLVNKPWPFLPVRRMSSLAYFLLWNFWFKHLDPHGQKLGSHSTSTSRFMHSSPHPTPDTGSGTHEQIKTSSSVTLLGSRCVKMLRWILCHTLSFTPDGVLFDVLSFLFQLDPRAPEGKPPGTMVSPRPCSSASCCALSRMSISSLSIS